MKTFEYRCGRGVPGVRTDTRPAHWKVGDVEFTSQKLAHAAAKVSNLKVTGPFR